MPSINKNSGIIFILAIFFLFTAQSFVFALTPEIHLPEPKEQRARELFLQIKCPVCAGQVIESSDTEIAIQLRKLVRQKIATGDSDEQIKQYLAQEYGDDIINSSSISGKNILLWILPLGFLVFGLWIIYKSNL